ncbi:hypothetical protein ACI2KR_06430 [Pseudomonas luteola]
MKQSEEGKEFGFWVIASGPYPEKISRASPCIFMDPQIAQDACNAMNAEFKEKSDLAASPYSVYFLVGTMNKIQTIQEVQDES